MPRLILGHTTERSVKIWVRGDERWPVAFVDVLDSADRKTSPTKVLELNSEEFWTDVSTWEGLSPNRPYRVKVSFGKSSTAIEHERIRDAYTEGRFRTFPTESSAAAFTFLLGSCNLHSLGVIKNPDKPWARVSEVSSANDSRFMIHCGDQIYADIPFYPQPDPSFYRRKYLDAWDDCRTARAFLTQTPQYMILDDHEIINNFDEDMSLGSVDVIACRNAAMKAYWEFQHKHNPDTFNPGQPRQYYYSFSFGATKFFVLDTRYRRSSSSGQMIDTTQFQSLKSWLVENVDQLKFIVTSVPFIGQVKRPGNDKWCSPCFAQQRADLFDFLHKNEISKTVFLTGDMHTSYYAKAKLENDDRSIIIHELMSSPINQFTPDTELQESYEPVSSLITPSGIKIVCKIVPRSFFGNHSNIMAISVNGDLVRYKIFRTTDSGSAKVSGSFKP